MPESARILLKDLLGSIDFEKELTELEPYQKSDQYYSLTCPECGKKEAFLYANTGIIECNRKDKCGYKNHFLAYKNNGEFPKGRDYALTMEDLKSRYYEAIPKKQPFRQASQKTPLTILSDFIEKSYKRIQTKDFEQTLIYAKQRGYSEEMIRVFKLGVVFEQRKGFGLVLPVHVPSPYYQIRWIQWDKSSPFPKYQNPKGSKVPYAIYGSGNKCFIMESLIDAMLISQLMGSAAIAVMGARVNLDILMQYDEVYLLSDTDKAGEEIIKACGFAKDIPLPTGFKDIGELIQKQGMDWVKTYLTEFTKTKQKPKNQNSKVQAVVNQIISEEKPVGDEPKMSNQPELENISFTYVTDFEEAEKATELFLAIDNPIALDTETTGLDCFQDRIRLIQLYHPKIGCYLFDLFQIGGIDFFEPLEVSHFVIHYAPFDVKMLKTAGINLIRYEDTKIMAALTWTIPNPKEGKRKNLERVPEAFKARDHSLSNLTRIFEGLELDKSKKLRQGWKELEISPQKLKYAAYDAFYLYAIYKKLAKVIEKRGFQGIYPFYNDALKLAIEMEYLGAPVRKEALEAQIQEINPEKIAADLQEKRGIKNINSNKQLTEYVDNHFQIKGLERTEKTKQINFSHKNLQNLLPKLSGEEKLFFEALAELKAKETIYREHKKLEEAINPVTGRVHAGYHLLGASSGRTLTSNPNFQGQASGVKAFIGVDPKSGAVITAADYSQQEMRVFSLITKHKDLLENLEAGKDAYYSIAGVALEKTPEDITKEERKLFKMIALAILYGKGSKSLAKDLKIPEQEARKKYSELRKILNVNALQKRLEKEHQENARVKTIFGQTTRLITDKWKTLKSYQLINYLIQGTASNIGVFALLKLKRLLPEQAQIVGFIHDEFLIEHPLKLTDQVKQATLKAMQDAFIESFTSAENQRNYLVNIKTGTFWNKG